MTQPQNDAQDDRSSNPGDDTGATDTGPENGTQGHETPNQEAARYRHRAKAAEEERDGLRDRLNGYLTTEAERIATTDPGGKVASLHDGADMWRHGVTLDDVLDDDGQVSEEKVREKIAEVTDGRNHLRRDKGPRRPKPDYSQGKGLGTSGAADWQTLLKRG